MNRWFNEHPDTQIDREMVNDLYQYITRWMSKYDPDTFNRNFGIWYWTHVENDLPDEFHSLQPEVQNRVGYMLNKHKLRHNDFNIQDPATIQNFINFVVTEYKGDYSPNRFDMEFAASNEAKRILGEQYGIDQNQLNKMQRQIHEAEEKERQRSENEVSNIQIEEEAKNLFLPAQWFSETNRTWKYNQLSMIKQYYIDTKMLPTQTITDDLYRYITEYMTGEYVPSKFVIDFGEFLKKERLAKEEETKATKITKRRRRSSKKGVKNIEMPNAQYTKEMPKELATKYVKQYYTINEDIKPNIAYTTEFVDFLINKIRNPKTPFDVCNQFNNYRLNKVARVGNTKAQQYYGGNTRKTQEKNQFLNKLQQFFSNHKEILTTDENITKIAEYIKAHPKVVVSEIPVIN